jgi:hypothetical protein
MTWKNERNTSMEEKELTSRGDSLRWNSVHWFRNEWFHRTWKFDLWSFLRWYISIVLHTICGCHFFVWIMHICERIHKGRRHKSQISKRKSEKITFTNTLFCIQIEVIMIILKIKCQKSHDLPCKYFIFNEITLQAYS